MSRIDNTFRPAMDLLENRLTPAIVSGRSAVIVGGNLEITGTQFNDTVRVMQISDRRGDRIRVLHSY